MPCVPRATTVRQVDSRANCRQFLRCVSAWCVYLLFFPSSPFTRARSMVYVSPEPGPDQPRDLIILERELCRTENPRHIYRFEETSAQLERRQNQSCFDKTVLVSSMSSSQQASVSASQDSSPLWLRRIRLDESTLYTSRLSSHGELPRTESYNRGMRASGGCRLFLYGNTLLAGRNFERMAQQFGARQVPTCVSVQHLSAKRRKGKKIVSNAAAVDPDVVGAEAMHAALSAIVWHLNTYKHIERLAVRLDRRSGSSLPPRCSRLD